MNDSLARYRPYVAMLFLFVVVLVGTIIVLRRPEPAALTIVTPTPRPTATLASIIVDVRGAVAKPGVYTLAAGSRVQDALAQAGDVLPNAETRNLNLARRLNDGEQIYIPTIGEATTAPPAPTGKSAQLNAPTKTPLGKINVNTATLEELDALPGIGPSIAQRIIDYRNQNGSFKKIDDLKKVRGVGDALFDQIRDLVTLQ
ncbi:MAG: helix-hairpin-helix domain-containing protein [Chloroflexota bacterium]|nr:helix-hairpin-helix domain-containing protein [Chloroflexota bacterium]